MKGKLLIPLLSLTCAVTCSFGLTACGGNGSKAQVEATGILLNRQTEIIDGAPVGDCIYFTVGQSATLTATLMPENATSQIAWSSDKPDIASVDGNGRITAHAKGNATITATVNGTSAFCFVSVSTLPITEYSEEATSFVREFIRPLVIEKGTDVKSEFWSVETTQDSAVSSVSILYVISSGGTGRRVELANVTLSAPVFILDNNLSQADIDCDIQKTAVFNFDAKYNFENRQITEALYTSEKKTSELKLIEETTAEFESNITYNYLVIDNGKIDTFKVEVDKGNGSITNIVYNFKTNNKLKASQICSYTMNGTVIYSEGYEYEIN